MSIHALYINEAVDRDLDQFSQHIRDSHDHIRDFRLYSRGDDIHLDWIEVEPSQRKKGIGSSVMKKLMQYADSRGKRITLNLADKGNSSGTTSRGRLSKFYKAHGFLANTGRNKDYGTSASMYRRPEAASRAGLINSPQHDYEVSAKKHFGTTNNPRAAGYILRDGSMLDFSGRKEGGDPNTRSYDHRNIDHADGIPSFDHSHTESMRNFMRHTKAIRLSHLDGQTNADFVAHPTPQQLRTLRRIIPPDVNHRLLGAAQRWDGESYDDFEDHDGHGRDFHGWLAKVKNSLNKFGVTETLITSLPTATELIEAVLNNNHSFLRERHRTSRGVGGTHQSMIIYDVHHPEHGRVGMLSIAVGVGGPGAPEGENVKTAKIGVKIKSEHRGDISLINKVRRELARKHPDVTHVGGLRLTGVRDRRHAQGKASVKDSYTWVPLS